MYEKFPKVMTNSSNFLSTEPYFDKIGCCEHISEIWTIFTKERQDVAHKTKTVLLSCRYVCCCELSSLKKMNNTLNPFVSHLFCSNPQKEFLMHMLKNPQTNLLYLRRSLCAQEENPWKCRPICSWDKLKDPSSAIISPLQYFWIYKALLRM